MRMRNKPWAGPELDACPFFIRKPQECLGRWHSLFPRSQPVCLELGCGKGFFLAGAAPADPGTNFIGIDIKDAVLGPAKRNIEKAFAEAHREPDNVLLTALDIERIFTAFGPEDSVRKICINFCNPWPRPRHRKRRLTHPRQLENYKKILEPGGELFFKTDDDGLFEDTLGYLAQCGFTVAEQTRDLRGERRLRGEQRPDDILTEFEIMSLEKGIRIKALRAFYR